MADDLFRKNIDRSRLDRLEGEILAFVSDAESQGYSNMEIARALFQASLERAYREQNISVRESFVQFQRDQAIKSLAKYKELGYAVAKRIETEKWN